MINKKTKYAIKALTELARSNQGGPMHIETLANKQGIPKKFLELILLDLKRLGFIESKRGKDGGYILRKSPDKITVGEVIRFFDGPLALLPCASVTRYEKCSDCVDDKTCSLMRLMKSVRNETSKILDNTKISELI